MGDNEKPRRTLELRIEFANERRPWVYSMALNGREVRHVYINGKIYVPVNEGDWDDIETE